MPESAAKAINRRKISTTNNGGGGNDSEMIKRCSQAHTTRDGQASEAQVPTAVPRSCVSRRSPAAACRLARTDRYTLEGPNHHANRVNGRGWASGAYFGALAIVMVVGGICECFLPYFHALKGFQSNRSVAKLDRAGRLQLFLQLSLQLFE